MTDEEREDIYLMLSYFWFEKGDIKRWVDYEERKHLFPEVVQAIKEFEEAKEKVGRKIYKFRVRIND